MSPATSRASARRATRVSSSQARKARCSAWRSWPWKLWPRCQSAVWISFMVVSLPAGIRKAIVYATRQRLFRSAHAIRPPSRLEPGASRGHRPAEAPGRVRGARGSPGRGAAHRRGGYRLRAEGCDYPGGGGGAGLAAAVAWRARRGGAGGAPGADADALYPRAALLSGGAGGAGGLRGAGCTSRSRHGGRPGHRPSAPARRGQPSGAPARPADHRGGEVAAELVGALLRCGVGLQALFVSPGHRGSLATALAGVVARPGRTRLPEPTKLADRLAARKS